MPELRLCPLETARHHHHVQVSQKVIQVVGTDALRKHALDDDQMSAGGTTRGVTALEDLDRLRICPVVDDEFHQVRVCTGRGVLHEIAGHELAPVRHACVGDSLSRPLDDIGSIEHEAANV